MSKSLKFEVSSFKFLGLCFLTVFLFSCQQNYTPKPDSYFRIDFPERGYQLFDTACPFIFEYPVYGTLTPDIRPASEPCWFNINFPKYRGIIYLTYKKIDNDAIFDQLIENEWTMVYNRLAQRADAVDPLVYDNPESNVFGTLYDIKGNAASAALFFVTDSVRHFLRGSLYFSVRPNQDSLAPAIAFFREDIIHLMESVRWKEEKIKSK
jgi:gliding motility-associated lipoprotein GldD